PDATLWIADQGNHRVLRFEKGFHGDRSAEAVLGQRDFNHASGNHVDGLGLAWPRDVAIDRSVEPNRLYVCDFDNHRILGYRSVEDLGPERQPDLIIGQPDTFSNTPGTDAESLYLPTSLAVDARGGLYVADRENNRVLWFDRPFETDSRADRVFGQPAMVSREPNNGGVSARSLNRPEGVAVDVRGNLYVADTRNHRVLRFDQPTTSDTAADVVWGQGNDFTIGNEFGGLEVRADTFSYPFGLDLRGDGLMAVADTNNHRVLLFDVLAPDSRAATRVLGQAGDFAGREDNRGGCSAASLSGPEGVAFRGKGLFVSDTANCRIVYYGEVTSGDSQAEHVYGQEGSFARKGPSPARASARTLWFPSGMDIDSRGNLYVADREQSRVLVFRSASREPPPAGSTLRGGQTCPAAASSE
ncbi:MAG TPA: NHL repeat-containing protein, partial [Phycisphaerae bacterium]|nr:NHL repeat-containing protein [Phycisphaerae bacterium]